MATRTEWKQCQQALTGLQAAVSHLSGVMLSMRADGSETAKLAADEIAEVLEILGERMTNELHEFVCPIWEELPLDVRQACAPALDS